MDSYEHIENILSNLHESNNIYDIQYKLLNDIGASPPEWFISLWRKYHQTSLMLEQLRYKPLHFIPSFLFEDIVHLYEDGALTDQGMKSAIRLFFINVSDIFDNRWHMQVPEAFWLALIALDIEILDMMHQNGITITQAMKYQYAQSLKDIWLYETPTKDFLMNDSEPYLTLMTSQKPHTLTSDEKTFFLSDSNEIWNYYIEDKTGRDQRPWNNYFLWIDHQPMDFPLLETVWIAKHASLQYKKDRWSLYWNDKRVDSTSYITRLLLQCTLADYQQLMNKISDLSMWQKDYPHFTIITSDMCSLFPDEKVSTFLLTRDNNIHDECDLYIV